MKTIVLGILRHLLTTSGGALVTKGLASADEAEQLVGAVLTLIGVAWSIMEKIKKSDSGKKDVKPAGMVGLFLIMLGCLLIQTGCASYLAVGAHDTRVDAARALQVQAGADGKSAYVGLDLLKTKGYMAAWKEAPATMTAATVVDLLTGIGAYYGIKGAIGGDDNSKSTTVTVNGDNNNTVVGGQDASGSHTQTETPPAENPPAE
jgi:hypothetical protein